MINRSEREREIEREREPGKLIPRISNKACKQQKNDF